MVAKLECLDQFVGREFVFECGHGMVKRRRVLQAVPANVARQGGKCAYRTVIFGQTRQIGIAIGATQAVVAGCAAQQAGLSGQKLPKFHTDVKWAIG